MVNLGNTEAWKWTVELFSRLIKDEGVRDTTLDYDLLRRLNDEFWKVAPFCVEDYYPLAASKSWLAWQYNRPQAGDGLMQAFRRGDESAQTHRLSGLDPTAKYQVTNFDTERATSVSGKDLMDKGLTVEIKDKPGAAVIVYRQVKSEGSRK